ncbi:hypothetical protein LDL76_00795 [Salegentibacter mishustinae]|uniref:hypothetical protein n=1 Tax=Salegentibacter mishustinae TaxID=270918 RepID=UPI001CE22E80|nr:hypothetical protein [Salegentibacter mishustinae]UBZ07264.1 hypothetical protein LDL76_00795 [Salegentibacter mishustinae]
MIKKVINLLNLYKFNITTEERILSEEEIRYIYNKEIPLHITDTGLEVLFEKIESSNVRTLTLGWIHITEYDFKLLSRLRKLQVLSIKYCYNDSIKWLPNNLTFLSIYGTTIQSMSEIKLDLPNLIELDLSGNALNNLDTLTVLPENLVDLELGLNLIQHFKICELPKNLEYLNLSNNLIENDLFNQITVHKGLKYLLLSNNKLVISTSVLHRILQIFPNLEYLELLDNKTDGVPHQFLGDIENKNCLEKVEFFLEGIEFKHKGGALTISDEKNLAEFVQICWDDRSLPITVVLSDIQYVFSKHLKNIPTFMQFQNGFYCFIEHDDCELIFKIDENFNQIVLLIRADTTETVALYFHKYFQEINSLISLNSHKNILPSIKTTKSCHFLKAFFFRIFKTDFEIKKSKILKISNGEIELLVNNFSFNTESKGKALGLDHENIKNIAFILISGKNAYPFIVKDSIVTNRKDGSNRFHFLITLREASDKANLVKAITNKYLNEFSLVETEVLIDGNNNKALQCFINPNHFFVKNGNLCNTNPGLNLDSKYLVNIEKDKKTLCEFDVENNFLKLKYVLK